MARDIFCVTLDFSKCDCYDSLYRLLQEKLDLPDWFGKNLDALWDAVTGIMQIPASIAVTGKPADTDLAAEVQQICNVFHRAQAQYGQIVFTEI